MGIFIMKTLLIWPPQAATNSVDLIFVFVTPTSDHPPLPCSFLPINGAKTLTYPEHSSLRWSDQQQMLK